MYSNGTSNNDVLVRIDGVSATNSWIQFLQAYTPSLEAIDTVNIVTNIFGAEQGLTGGTAVNVLLKSGTNTLHGSAFEYHQDNSLRANPFFLPRDNRNPS